MLVGHGTALPEAADQPLSARTDLGSRWPRALANADALALGDFPHEDFRRIAHTGESFTRSEYIERNTREQVAWQSQHFTDVDVVIVGTLPYCVSK